MSPFCTDPAHQDLDGPTRREMMQRIVALGLSVPMAAAALDSAVMAGPMSFLDRKEFMSGLNDIIAGAKSSELLDYCMFELKSTDMPWKDIDLKLTKGQEVTFLLGGRIWVSREADIWFEPGTSFNVRSSGKRPIYNPMNNTGTMIASHDGPVEIARSLGEWKSEDGDLWTPKEAYQQADVKVYGFALVWRGSAVKGLKTLANHGDVGGVIKEEISRLESPRKLPEGWQNLYLTGGGSLIFNDLGNGEISCQAHKNAGILQRPVSIDLKPGTKLNWRWIIEELPSILPEDQILSHDYLSVAAEYDDGQDLSYIWSYGLPVGKVFRCPLPRWTSIETHMVIRSGMNELGNWLNEERDLYADYKTHIGGSAKRIVRIWLLGISLFQRRHGAARFGDIQITNSDNKLLKL